MIKYLSKVLSMFLVLGWLTGDEKYDRQTHPRLKTSGTKEGIPSNLFKTCTFVVRLRFQCILKLFYHVHHKILSYIIKSQKKGLLYLFVFLLVANKPSRSESSRRWGNEDFVYLRNTVSRLNYLIKNVPD